MPGWVTFLAYLLAYLLIYLLPFLLACLLTCLFTYLHIYLDAREMYLGIYFSYIKPIRFCNKYLPLLFSNCAVCTDGLTQPPSWTEPERQKKTNTVCGDRGDIGILGSVGMQNVLSFSSDKWYCIWQML